MYSTPVYLLSLLALGSASYVLIQTRQGQIRSLRSEYFGDEYVDVFKGIPYAKPPVGSLRFHPPVAYGNWSGVRDGTYFRSACPQGSSVKGTTKSEDCLYLNVYTWRPKSHTAPLLPVMVFIHGGTFNHGAGSSYGCNAITLHTVVCVTINYRLGPLGFLSTGDDALPGNYGMLDQVMALEWVRDNIDAFGGDPGRVTVFGESAGAASISLLLISPMSRGLFHAAIMESGVSLTDWAFKSKTDKPSPLDEAIDLGRKVGCSETNTSLMVECLRKIDVNLIVSKQDTMKHAIGRVTWSPVVGDRFGFLPDKPMAMIDAGLSMDVPTIRGVNKDEGSRYLVKIPGISHGMTAAVATAYIRHYVEDHYSRNDLAIRAALQHVYMSDTSNPDVIRAGIIRMISDRFFYFPTLSEVEKQAARNSSMVYMYEFDYRSPKARRPLWEGVPHAGELEFVFGAPYLGGPSYVDEDKRVASYMMGFWTNFAKNGNPSYNHVTWKPFTSDRKSYLSIDVSPVMKSDPRPREEELWRNIMPKLTQSQTSIVG